MNEEERAWARGSVTSRGPSAGWIWRRPIRRAPKRSTVSCSAGRRRTCPRAGRVNDVGCFAWNELQSRDPETAASFYAALFGWETEPQKEDGKLAYVLIRNAGRTNGGIMPMTEQRGHAPPHWLTYFTVPSCDAAVEKVRELGGEVLTELIDLGAGRIAVARDT